MMTKPQLIDLVRKMFEHAKELEERGERHLYFQAACELLVQREEIERLIEERVE